MSDAPHGPRHPIDGAKLPVVRRPPNAGKGRIKGVPNKTTADLRKGFQLMVEHSIPKLQSWLDRVARDDPARALDIVQGMAEFCIPKLARTEHIGEQMVTLVHRVERVIKHE